MEDNSSTKDSDRTSMSSLNDQIYAKYFTDDRKMSIVSLLSCKDSIHIGSQAIPFELGILIQGLETDDTEKVKKFLNGIDDSRLNQLSGLSKDQVRLFMHQLMRLLSESGCV